MPESAIQPIGLARPDLEQVFAGLGEKPFRARQLMRWMYGHGVLDPDSMTDLSVALRVRLNELADFGLPEIAGHVESIDGTRKWRLSVGNGQIVETVFIPEAGRGTLCVSSQVGCALDCAFCATGKQGFNRNLTAAEIIGQVLVARREIGLNAAGRSPITNVVFMGMGEPLANLRPVAQACEVLLDDLAFGLSRRRVTVSTSGIVPQLRRLAELTNVALAVSLHAPDDALRDRLVPINRRYPIAELLDACWDYARRTSTLHVTFEYVMLRDVNDSPEHARQLVNLLAGRPAKVNLIPFNSFPGAGFERSSPEALERFRMRLLESGVRTITRRTRGEDIAAACGQLAGQVHNRVRIPLGRKTQEVQWLV